MQGMPILSGTGIGGPEGMQGMPIFLPVDRDFVHTGRPSGVPVTRPRSGTQMAIITGGIPPNSLSETDNFFSISVVYTRAFSVHYHPGLEYLPRE